ncbi:MAG: DEAD/DEAH box helicase family protein [Phycisphaerales bacterium]|nr:DEAD/DEAH box helicase family protein [Phycisphaerales bacterium]
MRLALRDYQRRAVDAVIAALDRRPILVAPTGSGKTVMATALVESLGVSALWLAHRQELIDQAATRLESHGLVCGIIMNGYPAMPLAQVQVASVQTLVRRDKPPADLIVIDECHHATADSYQAILDAYPEARVVGLTATPFRLDGRGLGDLFGELVVAAYTHELCDAGVLHRPKVWASKSPDLRGVKVIAGDYSLGALASRTNTAELNADIVATWQKRAAGRRTVVFAVDVAHSKAITEAFVAAGVPAEHVDGRTYERDTVLARLARGATLVVSNCMVLTEGWDLPALECAIIARPTASLNLHLQMIGRVMRAAEGKRGAIVLDHAGNHHVHGLVTRRLNYSLNGEKVGHSEPLGLRRCQACGLLFELHEAACPECGWAPSAEDTRRGQVDIHGAGELSEFDDGSFEYRRQIWNLIEAEREACGYREGWSFFRFKERFDVAPVVVERDGVRELIDPTHASLDEKRAVYAHLVDVAHQRGFADGWAAHRYREMFGCWPRGFVGDVKLERLRARFAEAAND